MFDLYKENGFETAIRKTKNKCIRECFSQRIRVPNELRLGGWCLANGFLCTLAVFFKLLIIVKPTFYKKADHPN